MKARPSIQLIQNTRCHPAALRVLHRLLFTLLYAAILCSCSSPQGRGEPEPARAEAGLGEAEIDAILQRTAMAALGEREGAILVIDPQSGRLRAVVNPRLAFEQAFPPGSAVKPFTALTALRAGLVDGESRTLCRARYAREEFEIVCAHPQSQAPFNLTQALAYSCNYYFARLGERLSESAFNATLASFGFGARTGVNVGGESAGSLPRGEWRAQEALGEGEHLLVTPVQLLAAYVALANGGHLYRPQHAAPQDFTAQESARIRLAPAHRAMLIEGMRGAVKYGTAARAELGSLPPYLFGKTGTSTSSNGFRTQGWFVGFAADRDPSGEVPPESVHLGVLVFLRRAHGAQSAEVARPVFEEDAKHRELRTARGDLKFEISDFGSQMSERANPPSAIRHPPSVRVRLVREKITKEVSLAEYLLGVLAGEASVEGEIEALKAQAVISRAFALKNRGRHASEGYDFCSTTHCQRFAPVTDLNGQSRSGALLRRAVAETEGEVVCDGQGQLIDAYFHAACGGMTADLEALWGVAAPPYLRGVRDDYCATMPHRSWTEAIPAARLTAALRRDPRSNVGARLDDVVIAKRDASGRAELIALEGERRRLLRGWDFKLIVGRTLGWNLVKSSRFEVRRAGANFVFRGSGFGHGLGLCQEGAHVMARRGAPYRRILAHYFPGTGLRAKAGLNDAARPTAFQTAAFPPPLVSASFPSSENVRQAASLSLPPEQATSGNHRQAGSLSDHRSAHLWLRGVVTDDLHDSSFSDSAARRLSLASEHFRATYPSGLERREVEAALRTLEAARSDIRRRLAAASLHLAETGPIEVIIHHTTQDFVAATGQPWWVAAVTRERRMELQPLRTLSRRGVLATTLRHEYTHAVIESLSRKRAPRWLAEGLAAHVAGEGAMLARSDGRTKLTREELERKLAGPVSAPEMRALYAAAYREVQALILADGEPSVWQRVARGGQSS